MSRVWSRVFSRFEARKFRKIISKFADKVGLVYFGYADQNSDDYKVIRGFTVSASHMDNHYSVGTVDGYNLRLAYRTDTLYIDGSPVTHKWMIMAFDLHTEKPIPHFLIGANNQDMKPFSALFSSFPNMHPMSACNFNDETSKEFSSRFTIYARPAKAADVENLFPKEAMRKIAAHLWPISIEQHDNVLYMYSINEKISAGLLDAMLKNGLWLAGHLDEYAEKLD